MDPTLLSRVPGRLRELACLHTGGSTDHSDGLLVLTEGMCDPSLEVWALCGSHPIHMGQESIPRDPISVLYLQCVLSPERVPTNELRVLP